MAYKEDYYEEVDKLFDTIKTNPFVSGDTGNAVSQEDAGQIQPAGWVENADATDGTATVKIDADGITITDGKLSVEDSNGNSIISGGVVKALTNDGAEVVIDGDGITISNGAITVENPSGTVIIDGTSNMFKITATGTIATSSFSNPANPGSTNQVDLATGFIYVPANLIYTAFSPGFTMAYLTPYQVIDGGTGVALDWFEGRTQLVNVNQTRVYVAVASSRSSGTSAAYTFRYFVLEETAF